MAQANSGQDDNSTDKEVMEEITHSVNEVIVKSKLTRGTQYDVDDIRVLHVYIDSVDGPYVQFEAEEGFYPSIDVDEARARVRYELDLRYRGKRGKLYTLPNGSAILYEPHKPNAVWILKGE